MRSMLIWLDDTITWEDLPDLPPAMRGGHYEKAGTPTTVVTSFEVDLTPSSVWAKKRVFEWRWQFVRKDGRTLFDCFEEVEP